MVLQPRQVDEYHVFLASPGDVDAERREVRRFFDEYNRELAAHGTPARFQVVDWENYSLAGVGRPQDLITRQTLERFRGSLALVIGVMDRRFGSPTGVRESGTEEEFEWALAQHDASGYPEIKWFFRRAPADAGAPADDAQAGKVRAFQQRIQDSRRLLYQQFADTADFARVLRADLGQWIPWMLRNPQRTPAPAAAAAALPLYFESFDLCPDDAAAVARHYGDTWQIGPDGRGWEGSVADGVHRLVNRVDANAVQYVFIDRIERAGIELPGLRQAQVEVDVRVVGAPRSPLSAAGLICRFDPVSRDYYAFTRGADGNCRLHRRDRHGLATLLAERVPGLDQDRFCRLAAVDRDGTLELSVDGSVLRRVAAADLPPGFPGIVAVSTGVFEFDNFAILPPP